MLGGAEFFLSDVEGHDVGRSAFFGESGLRERLRGRVLEGAECFFEV